MSALNMLADTASEHETAQKQKRNIELHMRLVDHSCHCVDKNCPSPNCRQMKDMVKHSLACTGCAADGCPTKRRVRGLFSLHFKQCRKPRCKLCNVIRIRAEKRLTLELPKKVAV
jgi:hypothetical protein